MNDIQQHTNRIFELSLKVAQYYVSSRYKHNFSGNGDDFIHKLRSSIQFRVDAVGWHYINLQTLHESAEAEYLHRLKNNEEWGQLISHLRQQYFLFDDIVFNLISLFEYVGNLVGYFWKGEHGKTLKWKGVAKSALDKSNEFPCLKVANVIANADRQLVTKLEDYRANIFHYQNHMGAVGTRIEFPSEGNPIKIDIEISDRFKKIFKGFSVEPNQNELIAYSKHAIMNSFETIEKIMDHFLEWPIEP